MAKIGEIIRKKRKEMGLKVYELARKVGVHPVYITQIEKHSKLPSSAVIKNIQSVLKIEIGELWRREKYPAFYDASCTASLFTDGVVLTTGTGSSRKVDPLEWPIYDCIHNSKANYKASVIGVLNECNPSKLENSKLINSIIQRMKKLRQDDINFLKYYKKELKKIARLFRS